MIARRIVANRLSECFTALESEFFTNSAHLSDLADSYNKQSNF